MANSRLPSFYHLLLSALLVLGLGACGGGGGTDDPGFIGGGVDEPDDPGDSGGDPTSGDVTSVSISLTDIDGNETTSITAVSPGTLNVSATRSGGQPVPDAIVNASVTIGELLPASGTALTDLNGRAAFRLEAGTEVGAGTATVSVGGNASSLNFQIGASNLRIGRMSGTTFVEGEIDAGATALPAGGSTPLTVTVVNSTDTPVASSVAILFGSSCASLSPPQAVVTEQANTVNGIATATYTATGCSGTDVATATIVQGNAQSASVTLDIASANVNSIAFLSADPELIALKGTGGEGRQENSVVDFQVLDTIGAPVQGANVAFSLSTELGGLSLTNDAATTNSAGIATAIVLSGNVSTSVRVTATIVVDGQQRSTVSDKLVVSTGLPDQNSLSVSVSAFNPGGGDVDGVTTLITVRMADKFNNPVPNGTVAFFTTEFGVIEDSCETEGGVCSVTWTSQEPRQPLIYNNFGGQDYISTLDTRTCSSITPDGTSVPCVTNGTVSGSEAVGLGRILGRRSTVMVSTIGEESFVDTNGDGLYDTGEAHVDLAEAFLDNNENRPDGSWLGGFDGESLCDPSDLDQVGRDCASGLEETFVDFNFDGNYTGGNGIYNGSLCPEELANLPTPSCSRELVSVRDDLVVVMPSSSSQRVVLLDSSNTVLNSITLGSPQSFSVVLADTFNNMPPAGATIAITSAACQLQGQSSFVVPNTSATGAYRASFTLVPSAENEVGISGLVSITLTNPVGGSPLALQISCFDPPF